MEDRDSEILEEVISLQEQDEAMWPPRESVTDRESDPEGRRADRPRLRAVRDPVGIVINERQRPHAHRGEHHEPEEAANAQTDRKWRQSCPRALSG